MNEVEKSATGCVYEILGWIALAMIYGLFGLLLDGHIDKMLNAVY